MGARSAIEWVKRRPKPLSLRDRETVDNYAAFFVDEETGGLRIDNAGPFSIHDVRQKLIPWLIAIYGEARKKPHGR